MISAQDFIESARDAGFDWYAGVPCSYFRSFVDYVIDAPGLEYISAANEGDAVAAMAGTALGGSPGVAMMQNSGLGNAVSPLSSLTWVFRLPVLLIVTRRGEPGVPDEPQHKLMGRITPDLLDLMEIPWESFPDRQADAAPCLERARATMARTDRPYALVMRKGTVSPYTGSGGAISPRPESERVLRRTEPQEHGRVPSRREALERIVAATPEDSTVVLATTGYTGRELYAIADRPSHLYMVGSMGCASSLGLGLALARPDLRVVIVDGDGAALMRLGNLTTLGAYGPGNLVHLILDNARHESTGGQATVSPNVSFASMAWAAGYALALEGSELNVLDEVLENGSANGPALAHLHIRPGTPGDLPRPTISPHEVKVRLMRHIGAEAMAEAAR